MTASPDIYDRLHAMAMAAIYASQQPAETAVDKIAAICDDLARLLEIDEVRASDHLQELIGDLRRRIVILYRRKLIGFPFRPEGSLH